MSKVVSYYFFDHYVDGYRSEFLLEIIFFTAQRSVTKWELHIFYLIRT
jgi:hypothetical protein